MHEDYIASLSYRSGSSTSIFKSSLFFRVWLIYDFPTFDGVVLFPISEIITDRCYILYENMDLLKPAYFSAS